MNAKAVLIAAGVALVAAFMLQNMEPDFISFLFWNFSLPRIVLILACLGIGFGAGVLYGRRSRRPPRDTSGDPGR